MILKKKFLIFSDLHFSNKLPFATFTKQGVTDRLIEQRNLFNQVYKLAKEEEVDSIFFLGDLFDKSIVDPITLVNSTRALMKTDRPIYLLPGNHDSHFIGGGHYAIDFFSEIENELITVIGTKKKRIQKDLGKRGIRFYSIAYRKIEDTEKIIKNMRKTMSHNFTNILLIHNSVNGAEHLGWKCEDGLDADFVCKAFDLVLAGHFHKKQRFGSRGHYIGAPMHHSFADCGMEVGFYILTVFENGKTKLKFVPSKGPRFYSSDKIKRIDGLKRGDYLRYEIESSDYDFSNKKDKLEKICRDYQLRGVNASWKHTPVKEYKKRIGGSEIDITGENFGFRVENMIPKYVRFMMKANEKAKKEMIRLGFQILETARKETEK